MAKFNLLFEIMLMPLALVMCLGILPRIDPVTFTVIGSLEPLLVGGDRSVDGSCDRTSVVPLDRADPAALPTSLI
jgi:hypothetical protein